MQFFGIVPAIFLRVRAHDWFSKLFLLNSRFRRLGRSHMTAGRLGFELFCIKPRLAHLAPFGFIKTTRLEYLRQSRV